MSNRFVDIKFEKIKPIFAIAIPINLPRGKVSKSYRGMLKQISLLNTI